MERSLFAKISISLIVLESVYTLYFFSLIAFFVGSTSSSSYSIVLFIPILAIASFSFYLVLNLWFMKKWAFLVSAAINALGLFAIISSISRRISNMGKNLMDIVILSVIMLTLFFLYKSNKEFVN